MTFTVRGYTSSDYPMLSAWWGQSNMPTPPEDAIPEASTLIVEIDGIPAISCSLVTTNIKTYCYMDFLIGNPELQGQARKEATTLVVSCLESFAKAEGFKSILCFSTKPSLTKYYESLGYVKTHSGLTSHIREL